MAEEKARASVSVSASTLLGSSDVPCLEKAFKCVQGIEKEVVKAMSEWDKYYRLLTKRKSCLLYKLEKKEELLQLVVSDWRQWNRIAGHFNSTLEEFLAKFSNALRNILDSLARNDMMGALAKLNKYQDPGPLTEELFQAFRSVLECTRGWKNIPGAITDSVDGSLFTEHRKTLRRYYYTLDGSIGLEIRELHEIEKLIESAKDSIEEATQAFPLKKPLVEKVKEVEEQVSKLHEQTRSFSNEIGQGIITLTSLRLSQAAKSSCFGC